jgi:cytoskeletal protein CcmA (bactofilin family)
MAGCRTPTASSRPRAVFNSKPKGSKTRPTLAGEVAVARPRKAVAASLIGSDLAFEGKLSGSGEVHLDGRIVGDVRVDRLIIGETGAVEGAVEAETVDVRGQVIGSIHAAEVRIAASAHVEADITHQQLSMETGAFFQGRCTQVVKDGAAPLRGLLAQPVAGAEPA